MQLSASEVTMINTSEFRITCLQPCNGLRKRAVVSHLISWQKDNGRFEWSLPNGKTELITETEYQHRGGKVFRYPKNETGSE